MDPPCHHSFLEYWCHCEFMMQNWCVTGCSLPREMCNPTQVHSWGVWELSTVKYLLCVINDFSNHFTHLSSNLLINYITRIAKASIFTHHALRNQQPPTSLSWARFLSVEITIGNSVETEKASNGKCLQSHQELNCLVRTYSVIQTICSHNLTSLKMPELQMTIISWSLFHRGLT